MAFILQIPLEVRLLTLFVLGTTLATQINHGVHRFSWFGQRLGPWLPPLEKASERRLVDYLPIVGWWAMRRDVKVYGPRFWLRPMLVELLFGIAVAALYWWEVDGKLTPEVIHLFGSKIYVPAQTPAAIHAQFVSHVVLFFLMAVASLIDIDEKIIPDSITIPGTLLGLTMAALLPTMLLPVPDLSDGAVPDSLWLTTPNPWPVWLNGGQGLVIGWCCFVAWWMAILDLRWFGRKGLRRGLTFSGEYFRRRLWPRKTRPHEGSTLYPVILAVGLACIFLVWLITNTWNLQPHWQALLTSLVGVVAGGGMIWAVRIIGRSALQQEAMGFGDVTLVAMIGAFLGWQPCLMLFFLAPLAGTFIAVLQWLITRRGEIWYGPFLCLGGVITIIWWAWLWQRYGEPIFSMGWIVPAILIVCLAMMWGMLTIWRGIKEAILRD